MKRIVSMLHSALFMQIGFFFLFCIIPSLVVLSGLNREIEIKFAKNSVNFRKNFEATLTPLMDPEIVQVLFRDYVFRPLQNSSKGMPSPEDYVHRSVSAMKAGYPGVFEVVQFDGKNQLIASYSDLPEFHHLLRTFGPEYARSQSAGWTGINKNMDEYRKFFGNFNITVKAQTFWNWYVDFRSFTRKRALIIIPENIPGKPWFIVWVSFPVDAREFAFRFLTNQNLVIPGGMPHGIIDLRRPSEEWMKGFGQASPHVPKIIALLEKRNERTLVAEGFYWMQFRINKYLRLLVTHSDQALIIYENSARRMRIWALFALAFGFFIFRKMFWQGNQRISIRLKLLLLFIYTTGIPLFLLFLAAIGFFQERRQILEKSIFIEHEEAIKEFDRDFLEYNSWVEEIALRLKGPKFSPGENQEKSVRERVNRLYHVLKPESVDFFNYLGETVFQMGTGYAKLFQKVTPLIGLQVARKISEVNETGLPPELVVKEQTIGATLESMGIDVNEIAGHLEGGPDGLVKIRTGSDVDETSSLAVQFFDTLGKIKIAGTLIWGSSLVEQYIAKRLIPFNERFPGISLVGTLRTEEFIPKGYPVGKEIREVHALIAQQATPIHLTFEENGGTRYYTGMIGALTRRIFYAISTDEKIRGEVRETAGRIALVAMFLMGIGIGTGLLISRNFLTPIRDLAQGIKSLKEREFSYRVPIRTSDEFGRLSMEFNRIMEGMADLELARVVQDTFFPQDAISAEGWEIFGTSASASRVGGDYFDYFPLRDGRILILIGDVAGHGVAAALVVAMAKALAFHPENPDKPSQILDLMNQCLIRTLQRKRLMSCFLAIFDPKSGILVASNAGQNYPFLIKSGVAEELKINYGLLGVKQKTPFGDHVFSLSDDDVLCLYTDGLIESLTPAGEMIGYGGFRKDLPGLIGKTARATETSIREWHKRLSPFPLSDDLTIVILQRNNSKSR